MRTFDEYHSDQMKDPEYKAEYNALEPELTKILAQANARQSLGLLSKKMPVKDGVGRGDISKKEISSQ